MSVPRLQLRPDLIASHISLGDRYVWVLNDPLSQAFHFFDDAEFGILRSLTQGGSFEEIEAKYRGLIEPSNLAQFLATASRTGLLVTNDVMPASRLWRPSPSHTGRPWWSQPLAIRLPGITPDRWLAGRRSGWLRGWLDQLLSGWGGRRFTSQVENQLTSPGASQTAPQTLTHEKEKGARRVLAVVAVLVLCALAIVGVRFDEFLADSADAGTRLFSSLTTTSAGGSSVNGILIMFAFAVVVTKVIHELSHAIVCTALGGRCREIGVLLLLGIPCLYCDVSDTWLMPRRRDRILVSAAGMIAEWTVAAIAVMVWATTQPGTLHDLAALIVIVASVSTLLINANPLLRYDGYYILSDWIGIPNLSAQARSAMRSTCSHWFRGKRDRAEPASTHRMGAGQNFGLVAYGMASLLYRTLVYAAIVWAAYAFIESRVGIGLALPITLWLGFTLLSQLRKRNNQSTAAEGDLQNDRGRQRWGIAGAAIVIALILFVPLPRSRRVGGLIHADDEQPVYVATPGTLVATGELDGVVQLDDWRLRIQESVARGRVKELRAELAAARIDRLDQPSRSMLHPILEERLASAEETHATIARRLDELRLGNRTGLTRYDPPPRRITQWQRMSERFSWVGVPLRSRNVGATMEAGTLLGRLGHPTRRYVSLFVRQESIDSVRPGQPVSVGYRGLPAGTLSGSVETISADPVDELPEEIIASGWSSHPQQPTHSQTRKEVWYEVTVRLDNANAREWILPTRLVTPTRIHLPATSLFARWQRWIKENF